MINVGILGIGRIAQDIHIPTIEKTEGLSLYSVCDSTPARLKYAHEHHTGVDLHEHIDAFLTDPQLEVVVVSTPSSLHAEQVCAALAAGKHVIVEKPMALTTGEAYKMIAAAESARKILTVYHNRRLDGDFMMVKSIVESGALGDVLSIEGHITASGSPVGYAVQEFNTEWRIEKKWGGGAIYDWGSHLIDQMLRLVPAPPVSVWADMRTAKWGTEVDDHSRLMIRFANGTLAEVEVTYCACLNKPRWMVYGTRGSVRSAVDQNWTNMEVCVPAAGLDGVFHPAPVADAWDQYYKNLAAAVKGDEEIMVKPEEGALVVHIIDSALKSAATGETVKLEAFLPKKN